MKSLQRLKELATHPAYDERINQWARWNSLAIHYPKYFKVTREHDGCFVLWSGHIMVSTSLPYPPDN